MKRSFTAELLSGHKGHALAVPFNPADEWKIQAQPLWHGRRGFPVKVRLKGLVFDSSIVPRQKRFFLLIDSEIVETTGVELGNRIRVTVEAIK